MAPDFAARLTRVLDLSLNRPRLFGITRGALVPVADRDQPLVERIQSGDKSAFELLMRRYEDKVFRLAVGIMRNREDALDAVQDAFLSVYKKIGTFRGDASFSTWLYRIALNSVYMRLRSQARHERTEPLDALESIMDPARIRTLMPARGWSERADDSLLRQELSAQLREAVAALPEDYRIIFTLR